MTTVLVTGGAGYIGSHTCAELLDAGFGVVVADNLCNSSEEAIRRVKAITGRDIAFYQADICDRDACMRVFAENPGIDAVIHFAALKAVGESVRMPLEYYYNNFSSTVSLLFSMREYGVRKLVFSSSATVYGNPEKTPVREDFPTSSSSPYGSTKLLIERMLREIHAADPEFAYASLRYFNPIGAHPSGRIGEDPLGIPNNLLPYVAQVAVGRLERVQIFGDDYPTRDGTGIRDYIHVTDLARGHVAALERLERRGGEFICNLGTGRGYSVLEVIAAFEKACGKQLPRVIKPRRPGDVAEVYADTSKAERELGWKARYGIEEMCADTWRWQSRNPQGYGKREEESR